MAQNAQPQNGWHNPLPDVGQALLQGAQNVGSGLGLTNGYWQDPFTFKPLVPEIQGIANNIARGAQMVMHPFAANANPQTAAKTNNHITVAQKTWVTPDLSQQTPTTSPTNIPQVLSAHTQQPVILTNNLPTQIPGVQQDQAQNFTNVLNNHILPITRAHGIPDSLVAGQSGQESGYGKYATGNNYFGIMTWDPVTGKRFLKTFNSPEDAATEYAQTVTNLVPNIDKLKNNPRAILKALQSGKRRYEADNADPMTYVNDISSNPAWKAYGGN